MDILTGIWTRISFIHKIGYEVSGADSNPSIIFSC
jgi:hypothetical protein